MSKQYNVGLVGVGAVGPDVKISIEGSDGPVQQNGEQANQEEQTTQKDE